MLLTPRMHPLHGAMNPELQYIFQIFPVEFHFLLGSNVTYSPINRGFHAVGWLEKFFGG